jgi:predicted nuclease with TOPRIM domain
MNQLEKLSSDIEDLKDEVDEIHKEVLNLKEYNRTQDQRVDEIDQRVEELADEPIQWTFFDNSPSYNGSPF